MYNAKTTSVINPANNNPTPQYPGQRAGLTYEQVQLFNKVEGLKVKGFTIPVQAGAAAQKVKIDLQGNGWAMIGLSGHAITNFANDAAMPVSISLMVNEEQIIDSMPWTTIDIKYMTHIYWPFQRYLSGSDTITLSIDNTAMLAQNIGLTFYYK